MKVLLDENMPHDLRVRLELHEHQVVTVVWMGWGGARNGALLQLAADEGFEAMITLDTGIEHEHNRATLPLAVVILHAPDDDAETWENLLSTLLHALDALQRRTIVHVE